MLAGFYWRNHLVNDKLKDTEGDGRMTLRSISRKLVVMKRGVWN
jgi:hypothetical protein